jgi:serine/threonine protein kinase/Tfp pilus assembly protein PilF
VANVLSLMLLAGELLSDEISATLGLFSMTPERWNKIKDLFSSAQECPEAERGEFLLRACGGDEELREAVEDLLTSARDDEFLARSAVIEAVSLFEGESTAALGSPASRDTPPRYIEGDLINERYEIICLLGRGGMGEVYLATDTRINRNVALKVLHADLISSKESLRRFEAEGRTVSGLNHPNIMTIFEFDKTDDGSSFIVSEFIDGKSLNRIIGGGIEPGKALEIAIQAASALAAAHDAGITHRDIKPENIMLRPDGYVKVLDFGLAKLTGSDKGTSRSGNSGSEDPTIALHKTRPGAVMGTAAYMSPEQARGLPVDARSDIWSLGVVLYEMLTGHRPFVGDTSADIIVGILLREPAPISSYLEDLPPELEWIVSKALSKNIDARYQTVKELRADLEKIKRQLEFKTNSNSFDTPISTSKARLTVATEGSPVRETDGGLEDDASPWSGKATSGDAVAARLITLRFGLLAVLILAMLGSAAYIVLPRFRNAAPIDSIAVLPFENPSGDPAISSIASGLSDALIDRLAQLPQLKVISRRSSSKFRGANVDQRDAAAQLGVRALVTGTISRVGDQIYVRIDVIDALEDRQLTGGQFQRPAADLVRIPDDIAKNIVEQLKLEVSPEQTRRLARRSTENSESFQYYLNGLAALNGEGDGREKARAFFEKAIELDPDFALGYAELAWLYWGDANATSDPSQIMPKARAAAEKALAIDPELAKAHVAMAVVHEYEFDWASAEREYRRAIELSPNLDFARNNYAFYLSILDRQDEALAQLEEQRKRDPLNQRLFLLQKAIIQVQAKRFDDALQAYQGAQAVDPSKPVPEFALGYAYAGKGLDNEAISYYKKAIEDLGGPEKYSQPLVYLAAVYAKQPERRAEARSLLARIESMNTYTSPALLAAVYAALDERDKAMELLERAYMNRDLLLRYIRTGYEYDSLRGDARFVDLERRAGLRK